MLLIKGMLLFKDLPFAFVFLISNGTICLLFFIIIMKNVYDVCT